MYEQAARRGRGEVLQRGLIGALRLAPPDAGIVLPHEDVMPGAGRRPPAADGGDPGQPGADLPALRRDGADSAATRLAAQVAGGRAAAAEHADTDDGIRHRLWALTDPAEQAAIAADLAPRQALIADGHHRYAAYLQLQADAAAARRADAPPAPWDDGLALLVDSTPSRRRSGRSTG